MEFVIFPVFSHLKANDFGYNETPLINDKVKSRSRGLGFNGSSLYSIVNIVCLHQTYSQMDQESLNFHLEDATMVHVTNLESMSKEGGLATYQ